MDDDSSSSSNSSSFNSDEIPKDKYEEYKTKAMELSSDDDEEEGEDKV